MNCIWCGKPSVEEEEIEVIQVGGSEVIWMHKLCAQRYFAECETEQEKFWAHEIPKFIRGEASAVAPGTVGEIEAQTAKLLVSQTPDLAGPENWRALRAAVAANGRAGRLPGTTKEVTYEDE
jgi:hypothetical protein